MSRLPTKPAPSKMCPHRHCRVLHWLMLIGTLVFALTSPILWMQIAAAISLLVQAYQWLLRRAYNLPHTLRGDRPNPYLIVRKGWARAAMVADCSYFLVMMYILAANISVRAAGISSTEATSTVVSAPPLAVLLICGLMFGYFGAIVFCHWMATRPGRPKRVKVPRGIVFHGGAA